MGGCYSTTIAPEGSHDRISSLSHNAVVSEDFSSLHVPTEEKLAAIRNKITREECFSENFIVERDSNPTSITPPHTMNAYMALIQRVLNKVEGPFTSLEHKTLDNLAFFENENSDLSDIGKLFVTSYEFYIQAIGQAPNFTETQETEGL